MTVNNHKMAERILEGMDFHLLTGHHYLGGFMGACSRFIGDVEEQWEWIEDLVEGWVAGIGELTQVAK